MLENKQLKEYVANIKKRYQEYQHRQQQYSIFTGQRIFLMNTTKKILKSSLQGEN